MPIIITIIIMIPFITFLLHLLAITINYPYNHKSLGPSSYRSLTGVYPEEDGGLCVHWWQGI